MRRLKITGKEANTSAEFNLIFCACFMIGGACGRMSHSSKGIASQLERIQREKINDALPWIWSWSLSN